MSRHLESDVEEIWVKPKPRWKRETYAVRMHYVEEIVSRLGCQTPCLDAFSLAESKRFERWWGPDSEEVQDAFSVKWTHSSCGMLWANPPFSEIQRVVHKLKVDHGHAILVVPKWETAAWWLPLQDLVIRMIEYPAKTKLFELVGMDCYVPSTRWPVQVSMVCGRPEQCFKMARDFYLWEFPSTKRRRRKKALRKFQANDNQAN
jgi:hypothetical protein